MHGAAEPEATRLALLYAGFYVVTNDTAPVADVLSAMEARGLDSDPVVELLGSKTWTRAIVRRWLEEFWKRDAMPRDATIVAVWKHCASLLWPVVHTGLCGDKALRTDIVTKVAALRPSRVAPPFPIVSCERKPLLCKRFAGRASWMLPSGGYFVSDKSLPGCSLVRDFRWLEFVRHAPPGIAYAAGMLYLRANRLHKTRVLLQILYERAMDMEEAFELLQEDHALTQWLSGYLEHRIPLRPEVTNLMWRFCPSFVRYMAGGKVAALRFEAVSEAGPFSWEDEMYLPHEPRISAFKVTRSPEPDTELASYIMATKPENVPAPRPPSPYQHSPSEEDRKMEPPQPEPDKNQCPSYEHELYL